MDHPVINTAEFFNQHTQLLLFSYQHLLGAPLLTLNAHDDCTEALFNAPFALVTHNTAPEPVFNYANALALKLFEYSWDEFTQLPSKLSAEPINQQARAALLQQVRTYGFIRNYQGIRRTKTGQRFQINNAVVWNLIDAENHYCGQAACFSEWLFL